MDPLILLIVGGAGLAGCVILLVLGMNMLREERAHKDGAPAAEGGAAVAAAPEPARRVTPIVVDPVANLDAPRPEPAKPAGGALAGVTARFGGGAARSNAHEVLRVLRDNLTGRLSVEIAGKRYASLNDVPDGEMRQALLTTLNDLNVFAGGSVSVAALEAPAAAATSVAAAKPAAKPAAGRPAPAAAAGGEYKLPPPTMNPFKQMAVMRELAKNPPPEPKGIMEQIDDVLQERIIGTPLIHRNLHVRPGPRGDAIFEADGQSYSSVDALPDVEVRDAIKAAITEWEKKQ